MAALIPFTSNYTDVSTYEGYQFEFCCQRCGNGYRSMFRHSVTGLLRLRCSVPGHRVLHELRHTGAVSTGRMSPCVLDRSMRSPT
jgi:hypothetical protein